MNHNLTRQFSLGVVVGLVISMILFGLNEISRNNIGNRSNKGVIRSKVVTFKSLAVDEGIADGSDVPDTSSWYHPSMLLYQQPTNFQKIDTTISDQLYSKIRVLCWILTSPSTLEEKALVAYKTWGHRCNIVLLASSEENDKLPVKVIKIDTEEGRDHLTAKTMHTFKHVYDNYFNQADWFLKADDDSFVIVENLRFFLADKDPNTPVFYGHHFKTILKQGYYSGGGGYVLSREALMRFATQAFHHPDICREDNGAEDAEFGKCLENVGVTTAESYDEFGKSRFHCFDVPTHLAGNYPDWYLEYDSHNATKGPDAMSDYAISYHYIDPPNMKLMEFLIYHLRHYGAREKNRPHLHDYYLHRH